MGKRVFLVRHAKAVDRREWDRDDCSRPLTPEGVEEFKSFLNWLLPVFPSSLKVVSSPCDRALETARILAELLNAPLKVDGRLAPDAEPEEYMEVVKAYRGNLALVGHEPDLSLFLNYLTCLSPAKVAFKKGAVAELRKKGGEWKLYALFNPKSITRSGRKS
ncbi:SixA phosphatase family protein [Thermovibrio ammonificans]|jgi:phosphohistidine phosphatase|uniref:Phosphohistidine phosphatase, SixA n=1 Tax=Thermovibrio ammonificans (strain DSM 15698 / JCM 12110 / HB-1) TaxID=648996 RepID=E8T3E9_THEA1|nr:histidine phosphatase family protein [Thermovibrio ammonificans]ADU97281.1 putative phosphohistidine phosphatase, SixA [Thermovibrio ammonificans HB-1]